MPGICAGFSLAVARAGERRAWPVALSLLIVTVAAAALERIDAPIGATDRALRSATFGLFIPLAALATVYVIAPGKSLHSSAAQLARFGVSRSAVRLGILVGIACASAAVSLLLAVAAILVTHNSAALSFPADLATTGWIALLAGASYATLFTLGGTFGARGRGAYLIAVADLVLANAPGLTGAVTPHAHLQNLLGAPTSLPFPSTQSQALSAAVLAALTLLCALSVSLRDPSGAKPAKSSAKRSRRLRGTIPPAGLGA